MILYGFKTETKEIDEGTFKCPACRKERACGILQPKRILTIYFVPTFPLSQLEARVVCRSCENEFDAPKEIASEYPEKSYLPHVLGIGAALVVGLILVGALSNYMKPAKSVVVKTLRQPRSAKPSAELTWTESAPFWNAQPDPPAAPFVASVKKDLSLPVPSGGQVVLPPTPSRLVGIYHVDSGRGSLQVYDWTNGQKVSQIPDVGSSSHFVSLDPDGVASVMWSDGGGDLMAWDIPQKRSHELLWQIRPDGGMPRLATALPGGRMVVNSSDRSELLVWDVPSDTWGTHMKLADNKSETFAGSPGGRYVAYRSGEQLWVADLRDNQVAARAEIPRLPDHPYDPHSRLHGLAFSSDGKKLAAVMNGFGLKWRIVVWNMVGGKIELDREFPRDTDVSTAYRGQYVEWMDDGFLIGGIIVLDTKGDVRGLAPESHNREEAKRAVDRQNILVMERNGLQGKVVIRPWKMK